MYSIGKRLGKFSIPKNFKQCISIFYPQGSIEHNPYPLIVSSIYLFSKSAVYIQKGKKKRSNLKKM